MLDARPKPHSDPRPCKFVQKGEQCPFGDKCKFQHVGVKRERNGEEPQTGRGVRR